MYKRQEYALDDEAYTNILAAAGLSREVLRDSYNQALEKAIREGSVDVLSVVEPFTCYVTDCRVRKTF